jgi:arylsulfatase A-like enzyme
MHLLLTQREALKAFVFERTTALVHCLEILKRAADWDGDGYTALLGGGDCDEGDPHRHPVAREVVGNGIDENCSGADLSAADVETAHRELAPEMAGGPAPRPPRPWNVLLLTVDALRFDRLDPARGPVLAPHLWRAQRAGVTFERAYAVSSWTNAAVYALLTSRFPSQVRWTPIAISSNDEILVDRRPWSAIRGLLEHKKRMPAPIFDRTPTFPEILRRAGYLTATFPSYLFFLRNVGLTRGFEVNDSSPYHALRRAGGGPEARLVTDRLLPLLTRAVREGRPFFAWVHYMDPHGPFPPGTGLSREEGYDRAVFAADAQVGRVLAWLETAQLASRTLVILSSDHGEEFRDHGGEYHGTTLYEEVLRAPVTFLVPGAPPRAVGGTVSHIDLLPTVLDLLGQPRPPGLMGRSLAPWLEGRAGDPPLRPVLAETYRFEAEKRALFDGAHKLILDRKHNTAELYDLQADPLELQNLVDDQPARAAGMRARLWRYLGALELDAPPDEEHARDQ